MVLDLTIATDRVRLAVADYSDVPLLPDSVYQYLLTKNSDNEAAATKEAAYLILGQLSQQTDERLDRLQFYGSQAFNQYLTFIQEVIRSPSSALNLATIYAAGVDREDVLNNKLDTTVIHHRLPIHDCSDYGLYGWHRLTGDPYV